jgi:hypothetical protein
MEKVMLSAADLQRIFDRNHGKPPSPPSLPMQARVLRDLLPAVQRANPFQIGDLVEQIPEFAVYSEPAAGKLAIVSALIDQDLARGKTLQWDRDDIVLLMEIVGKWGECTVESWRFRKYEGPVE